MNKLQIIPLSKPITADVHLLGSLSYTIRALTLAAMTKGTVTIENALKSDDTYAMFHALQTLGIHCEETKTAFIIYGNISDVKNAEYTLNIHLSGRSARMLLALLCIIPGIKTLTCDEGFKKRPMKDLVDGLTQLGANITYLEEDGCLPLKISSEKLHAGIIEMNGHVSSQYFSAIMMIAPMIGDISIVVLDELASKPYIDITIDTMNDFKVTVINDNYQKFTIKKNQHYKIANYFVEADASAASYFWGIAAVTGSTIKVHNLSPLSAQGDVQFATVLEKMGCTVIKNIGQKWIEVRGTKALKSIAVNLNHMPDIVPTLAVVAAYADKTTILTGLDHLKGKESNRLEAPKNELQKMGINSYTTHDSITIQAGIAHGAEIDTYGDHRIAMAFAVAGTITPGIQIIDPQVVNKSFPSFWQTLADIGIMTKEIA